MQKNLKEEKMQKNLKEKKTDEVDRHCHWHCERLNRKRRPEPKLYLNQNIEKSQKN